MMKVAVFRGTTLRSLGIYSVIQNNGLNFVRLYFLNYRCYMIDLYKLERGDPRFINTTARALAYPTAVQQRQLRTKWLLCSKIYLAFVS